MKTLLLIAAIFAAPLHAQVCSGGAAGGSDANGNQCSDSTMIGAYANAPDVASPAPSAKMSGTQVPPSVPAVASKSAKMSSNVRGKAPASAAAPSRMAAATLPPPLSYQTAKIELPVVSCSGGANSGMDATGNQC